MYETELLQKFEENHNLSTYKFFNAEWNCLTEVQVGSKIADIVLFDNNFEKIVAIELKVSKWKNAFRQALNYQLWASKSYIALYGKHIKNVIKYKEIFDKFGIGLISIEKDINIIIEAKTSDYLIDSYVEIAKHEIKNRLKRVEK